MSESEIIKIYWGKWKNLCNLVGNEKDETRQSVLF